MFNFEAPLFSIKRERERERERKRERERSPFLLSMHATKHHTVPYGLSSTFFGPCGQDSEKVIQVESAAYSESPSCCDPGLPQLT